MTKLVPSLLAFAVSSSVLLAQGWSGAPGKGLKYDGGDTFSFKMDNQLQTHWVYNHNENRQDANNFRVRRARTAFTGFAFNKNIQYVLRVDAIDTDSNLKDGYIQWTFFDNDSGNIGLRMGQGKTQFGLEATGSSKGLFFVERSDAARAFSDRRSRGAWIFGSHMDNKLRWNVGLMNGSASGMGVTTAEAANNDDDELSYMVGANFDPMGDITGGKGNEAFKQGDFREGDRPLIGTIGAAYSVENATAGGVDEENTAINVHTAWNIEGFQFMGEWFSYTNDNDNVATDLDADGFAVSANYILPKSADSSIQWGFGARFGSMDMTDFAGGDEVTDIALVANAFYHGHACKTQVELMQRDYDNADVTDYQISIAFQILF